ncbi:MAG: DUF2997 domain-containing protein [Thermodesulfobacteriota bacterium]|nr:DUF2997 domain-containing protein [Thermodesulfobacteriota bacterium]
MAKQELEIIIDENGEIQMDIKGMKGKKCLDFAQMVAKAVGELKDKKVKPEFYQQEVELSKDLRAKNE